ncbi:hypothetical protein AMTR_s00088p00157600 [Amborella trichopoda]|uniref:Uncharacterized protein n=1 Tax=Amborella trichopoda TaxID=13333 RepID=W1NVH0_AMBTC|nr:hypothetical protein AMTR_s00088p00157600 [Amborella trichopoda]
MLHDQLWGTTDPQRMSSRSLCGPWDDCGRSTERVVDEVLDGHTRSSISPFHFHSCETLLASSQLKGYSTMNEEEFMLRGSNIKPIFTGMVSGNPMNNEAAFLYSKSLYTSINDSVFFCLTAVGSANEIGCGMLS